MFIIICAVCIPISGFSPGYLLNEIVTRLGRNAFLILSLLIPIMAGMGLNFGMTLGAMAGEIGLIFVADWQIWGIPGIILAMIISIPISILLGLFCGKMLNMAKGREMVTSYIISFFMWFRKTKLGQDMRAVGQDMDVAGDAGIKVERTRIIAIIMSTVFAGLGMVIYLQNMGNISTYSSHTQIGMFCIAALLVGGASVDRASIGNVFLGVILFHLMFIVAPKAGATITGDSMIGEYFRVFISYGVITVALIMYETKKRRAKGKAGQMLQLAQSEEGEN